MNDNNGNGHDKPGAIRRRLDLKKRQAVLRRDGCKCVFCGKGPPQYIVHVDHKKPWIICVKEGLDPDGMDNLQTVCEACNQGKLNYWDDSLDLPVLKLPIDDNQFSFNFNGDHFSVEEIARVPSVLTPSFDAQSLWAVGYPNGKWWGFKKLLGAEQHRLEMQYWNKHGHGNFCWLPDDIYFADNHDAPNLGELMDDSHKKYNLLPKWPIKFVADPIQTIQ